MCIREGLESLYFAEDAVLPLAEFYQTKLGESMKDAGETKALTELLINVLTDAIVYFRDREGE